MPLDLRSSLLLVTLPLASLSAVAVADVIDPAEEACGAAGQKCTIDGQDGACVAETCSRLDYGNPGPDGTPGTAEYECVRCIPGAAAAAPEPEPEPEPAPDQDYAQDYQADDPAANVGPEPQSTSKGTSCAVAPGTTSMMSVLFGLGLLGLALRRRRR